MSLNRPRSRLFWRGVALMAGGVLAQQAAASCRLISSSYVAQDVVMDMGQIVVLPSTPVGGLIKDLRVAINGSEVIGRCDFSGGSAMGRYVNATQQMLVPGYSNVYQTDVAGVGIRLYRDSGSIQTHYPHTLSLGRSATVNLASGTFRIELIKTAAQTGSGVVAPNGRFTTYYLDGDGATRPLLTSTFRGTGTTVVSPTCEVLADSRNIVVDFGSVPNTSFSGVGSRAVNRDFNIRLNCQGSNVAQYQSTIGIRLDATADSANLPGVLAITGGANSATRIGIEMVRVEGAAERPIQFGQSIPLGTTVSGDNAFSLPLRARYIQTQAGTVGGGNANGTATFTIDYN